MKYVLPLLLLYSHLGAMDNQRQYQQQQIQYACYSIDNVHSLNIHVNFSGNQEDSVGHLNKINSIISQQYLGFKVPFNVINENDRKLRAPILLHTQSVINEITTTLYNTLSVIAAGSHYKERISDELSGNLYRSQVKKLNLLKNAENVLFVGSVDSAGNIWKYSENNRELYYEYENFLYVQDQNGTLGTSGAAAEVARIAALLLNFLKIDGLEMHPSFAAKIMLDSSVVKNGLKILSLENCMQYLKMIKNTLKPNVLKEYTESLKQLNLIKYDTLRLYEMNKLEEKRLDHKYTYHHYADQEVLALTSYKVVAQKEDEIFKSMKTVKTQNVSLQLLFENFLYLSDEIKDLSMKIVDQKTDKNQLQTSKETLNHKNIQLKMTIEEIRRIPQPDSQKNMFLALYEQLYNGGNPQAIDYAIRAYDFRNTKIEFESRMNNDYKALQKIRDETQQHNTKTNLNFASNHFRDIIKLHQNFFTWLKGEFNNQNIKMSNLIYQTPKNFFSLPGSDRQFIQNAEQRIQTLEFEKMNLQQNNESAANRNAKEREEENKKLRQDNEYLQHQLYCLQSKSQEQLNQMNYEIPQFKQQLDASNQKIGILEKQLEEHKNLLKDKDKALIEERERLSMQFIEMQKMKTLEEYDALLKAKNEITLNFDELSMKMNQMQEQQNLQQEYGNLQYIKSKIATQQIDRKQLDKPYVQQPQNIHTNMNKKELEDASNTITKIINSQNIKIEKDLSNAIQKISSNRLNQEDYFFLESVMENLKAAGYKEIFKDLLKKLKNHFKL